MDQMHFRSPATVGENIGGAEYIKESQPSSQALSKSIRVLLTPSICMSEVLALKHESRILGQ